MTFRSWHKPAMLLVDPFQVNLEYVALVPAKDTQLKMKIEFSIQEGYWAVIHHECRPLVGEDNLARLHLGPVSLIAFFYSMQSIRSKPDKTLIPEGPVYPKIVQCLFPGLKSNTSVQLQQVLLNLLGPQTAWALHLPRTEQRRPIRPRAFWNFSASFSVKMRLARGQEE